MLFMETRQQRPEVWDQPAWNEWLAAIGQTIAAFPTFERRWACITLVADDLTGVLPGLSLPLAFHTIAEAVFHADVTAGTR
jgi:hypothetical protein